MEKLPSHGQIRHHGDRVLLGRIAHLGDPGFQSVDLVLDRNQITNDDHRGIGRTRSDVPIRVFYPVFQEDRTGPQLPNEESEKLVALSAPVKHHLAPRKGLIAYLTIAYFGILAKE